jgi:hypothetical protein
MNYRLTLFLFTTELSGGSYFNFNRLGYYLGKTFIQDLVQEVGEEAAFVFWCNNDIKEKVISWLIK